MKNLLNLNGAQALSKTEQKSINGGSDSRCNFQIQCQGVTDGTCCENNGSYGRCMHSCCRTNLVCDKRK